MAGRFESTTAGVDSEGSAGTNVRPGAHVFQCGAGCPKFSTTLYGTGTNQCDRMKLKYTIFAVLTCILLAGLEVKTVAAETQLSPAEAKAKLESSAVEIATLRSNIFLTLTELDQMRNPQNRQAAFQRFSAQLTNVVDQVHATAERV